MDWLAQLVDVFLHLDAHLDRWMALWGLWSYALLFAIVFCETGLVVTPFLPGDSLLFATGALVARPGAPLELGWVVLLLVVAAVAGDSVNYAVGRALGPRVFVRERSWVLDRRHLDRAQAFYERHGGKTIVLARFVPIIRTFAPFVAGVGAMFYERFALYNVLGAVAWVASLTGAGYLFGNLPVVRRQFHLVIVAIIVISVLPAAIEALRARRARSATERGATARGTTR